MGARLAVAAQTERTVAQQSCQSGCRETHRPFRPAAGQLLVRQVAFVPESLAPPAGPLAQPAETSGIATPRTRYNLRVSPPARAGCCQTGTTQSHRRYSLLCALLQYECEGLPLQFLTYPKFDRAAVLSLRRGLVARHLASLAQRDLALERFSKFARGLWLRTFSAERNQRLTWPPVLPHTLHLHHQTNPYLVCTFARKSPSQCFFLQLLPRAPR
jgi:hypothetical protein